MSGRNLIRTPRRQMKPHEWDFMEWLSNNWTERLSPHAVVMPDENTAIVSFDVGLPKDINGSTDETVTYHWNEQESDWSSDKKADSEVLSTIRSSFGESTKITNESSNKDPIKRIIEDWFNKHNGKVLVQRVGPENDLNDVLEYADELKKRLRNVASMTSWLELMDVRKPEAMELAKNLYQLSHKTVKESLIQSKFGESMKITQKQLRSIIKEAVEEKNLARVDKHNLPKDAINFIEWMDDNWVTEKPTSIVMKDKDHFVVTDIDGEKLLYTYDQNGDWDFDFLDNIDPDSGPKSKYEREHLILDKIEEEIDVLLSTMPKLRSKVQPLLSEIEKLHQDIEMYEALK